MTNATYKEQRKEFKSAQGLRDALLNKAAKNREQTFVIRVALFI